MGSKKKEQMAQEQTNIRERQHTDLREPRKYMVFIHNDDFTPMDLVVVILKQVFFYSEEKAEQVMLQVHHSDKAMVGVYTYDIAMSKVNKATRMAREQNYPLRLTFQPE